MRYLPLTDSDRAAMLDVIGAASIDDLFVDVPRELQHARLVARDGITPALADAMLDAQASRAQRLAIADDVITNDGTLADLDARMRALHEQYLARARGESDRVDP